MRVVALGRSEALLGLMLGGIKYRLETEEAGEALEFLHKLEEEGKKFLVIVTSQLYRKIEEDIEEIQSRNPAFIFYEFSGGGLKWRN
ncbi:MAG: V-type ATP synthase subunit F [Thermoproteota archaeon]